MSCAPVLRHYQLVGVYVLYASVNRGSTLDRSLDTLLSILEDYPLNLSLRTICYSEAVRDTVWILSVLDVG
jgi:hypothetical protein